MKTFFPTPVEPVKEMRGRRLSCDMALPTSAPPQTKLHTAVGRLLFSSTFVTILVVAILHSGVDGAPFQTMVLPQI